MLLNEHLFSTIYFTKNIDGLLLKIEEQLQLIVQNRIKLETQKINYSLHCITFVNEILCVIHAITLKILILFFAASFKVFVVHIQFLSFYALNGRNKCLGVYLNTLFTLKISIFKSNVQHCKFHIILVWIKIGFKPAKVFI